MTSSAFEKVLVLDSGRHVVSGSPEALRAAIARGADLRIYTGLHHNEHIEPGSDNPELIDEVSDFRVTWLIDGRWGAGIMNLRMPVTPPVDFGERPSWSFFMYNEDGQQAIARPFLDNGPKVPPTGECPAVDPSDMPKYHTISMFDQNTNAPSQNFVYDFTEFRYYVRDRWQEVYSHDENGNPLVGSLDDLVEAFREGREFKASIRDFDRQPGDLSSELFSPMGSGYYNTERRIFSITSQPIVMVKPSIPMRYGSGNWSYGNLLLRNDGQVVFWRCNPYTLEYEKVRRHCAIRYFVS
jgi:hypothetical protein